MVNNVTKEALFPFSPKGRIKCCHITLAQETPSFNLYFTTTTVGSLENGETRVHSGQQDPQYLQGKIWSPVINVPARQLVQS